jgi:hypothetical protein
MEGRKKRKKGNGRNKLVQDGEKERGKEKKEGKKNGVKNGNKKIIVYFYKECISQYAKNHCQIRRPRGLFQTVQEKAEIKARIRTY